jgi:mono/diheme cytochrome c family protein
MRARQQIILLVLLLGTGTPAIAQEPAPAGLTHPLARSDYHVRIHNGFKRYHAVCNHCHGPDGLGSTVAPPLIDGLPGIEAFRRVVREGTSKGTSVMQGFASDPNVAPYIDDIYSYLEARAAGTLGRGSPAEQNR